MQQNNRWRLYTDRNEMINHLISECFEFEQNEYETRHGWIGKVIPPGIVQEV